MMSFKNHNAGFSLIEVLLTLVLIGLVITPLLLQQGTVSNNVYRMSRRLEHIYAAEQFWYEAYAAMLPENPTNFSLEKTLADGTVLTFSRQPLNEKEKSPLAKQQNLVQERVIIAWKEFEQSKRDQIITYAYVVPEDKTI